MDDQKSAETFNRTTLETIAGGSLREQFEDALTRVMANIDDLNCEAKAKRTITLEIEFAPDGSRQAVTVAAKAKTKLASPKKAESVIFVVRDRTGEVFAVNNNVHQPELFKS